MKASELKQRAFESISKEIDDLEKQMTAEAKKGMLRIEVKVLSDAKNL